MAKFQQWHYREVADTIHEYACLYLEDVTPMDGRRLTVLDVVARLADMFERDNPRFDRRRFEYACWPQAWMIKAAGGSSES